VYGHGKNSSAAVKLIHSAGGHKMPFFPPPLEAKKMKGILTRYGDVGV